VKDGSWGSGSEALAVEAYKTKEVDFKFRGRNFRFALSHGLFSAADIDGGTRFLLKVLSKTWDDDIRQGRPLPKTILDAGCGVGVLGICAGAVLGSGGPRRVRCQDRDELARAFTLSNAFKNNVSTDILSAHTEPLLGGPFLEPWDLILSNVPAKAGKPVLEDFVSRSAGLLTPSGRVILAAVNSLAGFFRSRILKTGAAVLHDETGKDHTVFVYGSAAVRAKPIQTGEQFFLDHPFYQRNSGGYELEGVSYTLDAVQGVGDFDSPGGTVRSAAKLITRLYTRKQFLSSIGSMLIHEPAQGHFPAWFIHYLARELPGKPFFPDLLVLSSRNILALEGSRHNIRKVREITLETVPLADLNIGRERLSRATGYDLIVAFPEPVPRTDRIIPLWEGITALLTPKGIAVLGFPASEAERFDRKKPQSVTRLCDSKHKGFRALAYQIR
jgi:hypothetical protein